MKAPTVVLVETVLRHIHGIAKALEEWLKQSRN